MNTDTTRSLGREITEQLRSYLDAIEREVEGPLMDSAYIREKANVMRLKLAQLERLSERLETARRLGEAR